MPDCCFLHWNEYARRSQLMREGESALLPQQYSSIRISVFLFRCKWWYSVRTVRGLWQFRVRPLASASTATTWVIECSVGLHSACTALPRSDLTNCWLYFDVHFRKLLLSIWNLHWRACLSGRGAFPSQTRTLRSSRTASHALLPFKKLLVLSLSHVSLILSRVIMLRCETTNKRFAFWRAKPK